MSVFQGAGCGHVSLFDLLLSIMSVWVSIYVSKVLSLQLGNSVLNDCFSMQTTQRGKKLKTSGKMYIL